MISVYGYMLKKERYGKQYYGYIESMKNRDLSDINNEKEIQNNEFLRLLHYAVERSPFYKRFYRDVDLSQIKSLDDIGKLPILEKEILRQNIKDVFTINPLDGILYFTGGTTGKSLMVVHTKEDNQKRVAIIDSFKLRHGFENIKMKAARFSGKNIVPLGQKKKFFWRDNRPIKQRIYSTMYISQENIPYYVENLNRYKPEEIDGYPTSIFEIANYMKEHNIKTEFTPKAIFSTAETVLPVYRQVIEEVFGCPLRDQYSSNEGAPFITECICGQMHEDITTGVFEHIKTENGIKLIVTSFFTYGTPLIRYDIGDNIIECDTQIKCNCGCSHPIVKGIEGRKSDFLISEDRGNVTLCSLSNVIKGLPNCVKNVQFVQNDLKQIDIYIVVDTGTYKPEYDDLITKKMTYRFGGKMMFPIHKVNEIAREKSGKYSFIKNNIKPGK
jgi:phenylacetate-CoA ligase